MLGPGDSDTPAAALTDGEHKFEVYGIDEWGNSGDRLDIRITVDTRIHGPKITSGPPAKVRTSKPKAKVTFDWGDNENWDFECKLDNAAFTACTAPKTYKAGPGKHTFHLRATDQAGNVGIVRPRFRVTKI